MRGPRIDISRNNNKDIAGRIRERQLNFEIWADSLESGIPGLIEFCFQRECKNQQPVFPHSIIFGQPSLNCYEFMGDPNFSNIWLTDVYEILGAIGPCLVSSVFP